MLNKRGHPEYVFHIVTVSFFSCKCDVFLPLNRQIQILGYLKALRLSVVIVESCCLVSS